MSTLGIIKIIHILAAFLFVAATAVTFFADRYAFKIVGGITQSVLLFAGIALALMMKVGFPLWIAGKLGVWILFTLIVTFGAKRFSQKPVALFSTLMMLTFVAIILVVFKP